RRFAVASACSPATPAPSTSTEAGGTVPAAVVSVGKNRGNRSAASSAARYPVTVAWDDSASRLWARETRGTASTANARTPALRSAATPSVLVAGARRPTNTAPDASRSTSAGLGADTVSTMSAPQGSPSSAPARSYSSSSYHAPAPAPGSQTTRSPRSTSCCTWVGTSATLRSPGAVSATTPIRVGVGVSATGDLLGGEHDGGTASRHRIHLT